MTPASLMSAALRVVLCALLACLVAAVGLEEQRVELTAADWMHGGVAEPVESSAIGAGDVFARLPFGGRNERWATVFETADAFTARAFLDWAPGPDGLLFEIVLDGERLPPPRDGWRPTPRALATDLGSVWLGQGRHLLEFVSREEPGQPAPGAALHVRALRLQRF